MRDGEPRALRRSHRTTHRAAYSGFYTHSIVAVYRNQGVRFSITVRQRQSVRNIIEAIPETDWTPIPYWMEGTADVAETEYIPFGSEPDAATVRLIVRRVKPTPGSQLALFTTYSYHAFITDRDGDTLDLEADHRRHAEVENAIRDLKYGVGLNHLPSGRFAANAAWLAVQVIAHNLARWTTRIGLGEPVATTKTLRRRFFSLAGRPHSFGAPPHPAPAPGLALAKPVQPRSRQTTRPAAPFLIAPMVSDCPPDYPTPGRPPPAWPPRVSRCNLPADLARRRRCGPSRTPSRR